MLCNTRCIVRSGGYKVGVYRVDNPRDEPRPAPLVLPSAAALKEFATSVSQFGDGNLGLIRKLGTDAPGDNADTVDLPVNAVVTVCITITPPETGSKHFHYASLDAVVDDLVGKQITPGSVCFGPHEIHPGQIFFATPHCFALTNLKPVLPGHVLVICRRNVGRLSDMTMEEVSNLWVSVQLVCTRLEKFHGATSASIALQDGPHAGQTVPHVHVHILPRHKNDLEDNDEVYDLVRFSWAALLQTQIAALLIALSCIMSCICGQRAD
jgi:diadenosine tetraphosphate (Ap4A) HIT family hydrolase